MQKDLTLWRNHDHAICHLLWSSITSKLTTRYGGLRYRHIRRKNIHDNRYSFDHHRLCNDARICTYILALDRDSLKKNRPVLFLEAHIYIFLKLVQACSISKDAHSHLSQISTGLFYLFLLDIIRINKVSYRFLCHSIMYMN